MFKKKKISRIHTSRDVRYHQRDRAVLRSADLDELDEMPIRETMRAPIWRGDNGHGDDTSFAGCASGQPSYRVMKRILKTHIGKSFDRYYSRMCKLYSSEKDRDAFDTFIKYEFTAYGWGGMALRSDYSIVNGIIVKNER